MKRLIPPVIALIAVAATTLVAGPTVAGAATTTTRATEDAFCETHVGMCPDTRTHLNYEGDYVGHDEPSILFYSNRAGSGTSASDTKRPCSFARPATRNRQPCRAISSSASSMSSVRSA